MTDSKEGERKMNYLNDFLGDLDEEQVKFFHSAYNVKKGLTNEEVKLSRTTHIVICYDYIRLKGVYGFHSHFDSSDAKEYFSKMKDFSGNSFDNILDKFDYTYHFNKTPLKRNVREELVKEFGDKIDFNDLTLYHFALYTNEKADREKDIKSPRIHFMLGRYGMIYILFYDPYHELC